MPSLYYCVGYIVQAVTYKRKDEYIPSRTEYVKLLKDNTIHLGKEPKQRLSLKFYLNIKN